MPSCCIEWEHGHSSFVYTRVMDISLARGRVVLSRTFHNLVVVAIAAVLAGALAAPCRASASGGSELGMVDSIGEVTDVIVGHNTRGPYSLSWTNFDADGISVIINGRSLKNVADYRIDIAKGIVSFNSVLVNDAIVRVSYRTLPGKSKRAVGGTSIPVTLNLRSSATGNLRMTGLFAQDDPKNPNAGKSIIGLGGDKAWGSGKLNSMFLISQRNESSGSDGGLWDRAAMKFGGDTSIGMLKFSGSYLHAGDSFGGGKEYGTDVGKELINLATAFAPTKTVQASASFLSAEDSKKGTRTVTNEQSLVFTPVLSTQLAFKRSTSDLTVPGGMNDNVSTSGVQLSSTAIRRVTLRSSMTQRTSDLTGAEQAFSAGVSAKPIDQVSFDVGYATLESNAVGHQASTDVKVSATPVKQVAVQAAYSGVDSTRLGQVTNSNVSVSSTPAAFAKLTAMFSQKGIDSLDDVTKGAELQLVPTKHTRLVAGYKYAEAGPRVLTIHDYLAETKPWDFLSLMGTYRQRDVRASDMVDSASMSMSLSPARFFALKGNYQSNPEDTNGLVQNFNTASVGLTTQIGSVGLETNYFQKDEYAADRLSDERGVGLAVPAFGHGQISTGCRLGRTLGSSDLGTRTYSLGYRHSMGSDFSLSLTGNYTQYLLNKMLQPDKTEVSAEASLGARF